MSKMQEPSQVESHQTKSYYRKCVQGPTCNGYDPMHHNEDTKLALVLFFVLLFSLLSVSIYHYYYYYLFFKNI